MSRFTETVVVTFGEQDKTRNLVAKDQEVTINAWDGAEFLPTGQSIPAGGSGELNTQGMKYQFVIPAGGVLYIQGETESQS